MNHKFYVVSAIALLSVPQAILGCSSGSQSQQAGPQASPSAPIAATQTPTESEPEKEQPTEQKAKSIEKAVPMKAEATPKVESPQPEKNENAKPPEKLAAAGTRSRLFACNAENGREILLYETPETIEYSFGRPGATPELDLKVPRDRASTWQWKGVGRYMSYSVDVPNGNTVYRVFWGVDRLSETREIEAGVHVEINEKLAATVKCVGDVDSQLQGVKLKPSRS